MELWPLGCRWLGSTLRARRFAQALGQEAKTDAVDARILARMGEALPLLCGRVRRVGGTDLGRDGLVKDPAARRSHHEGEAAFATAAGSIERQIRALDGEFRKLLKADPALTAKPKC